MRPLFLLSVCWLFFYTQTQAQLTSEALEYADEMATTEGHIEILNDQEAVLTLKKRYTILNEHSEANLFYTGYNDENKLLSIDADIYDLAGNKIRKVKKSEIRDVLAVDGVNLYTENRVRYIELNHPTYPYVVEFNVKKKIKGINFAAFPNWYFQERATTYVQKSSFKLSVPDKIGVQYKLYNSSLEPVVVKENNSTTYEWTLENIASFESEAHSPAAHRLLPVLRITPKQFKIDKYEGSMASWQDYGQFLYNIWEGRDELPEHVAQTIKTLTASAATDEEKVAILYRYMQQNMRYVSIQLGIGGWQPFTAEYVEEHGYGDCKALSNYMKAMLKEVGIESYPVIVSAGKREPYVVEDDFVDPAFNHAILYVPEQDIWLECTSKTNPAGYLGSFTSNRKVLLVTPEGGKLANTPKLQVADNTTKETVLITINEDGSAHLDYAAVYSGIPHEEWRHYKAVYNTKEIEEEVRELGKLPNVSFTKLDLSVDSTQAMSQLEYSADAGRYASKAGKRLFVPINLVSPQQYVPEEMEERKMPIVLGYGVQENSQIKLTIPEGYRIESAPKSQEIASLFGTYSLTFTQEDNVLIAERKFVRFDEEQAAEHYEAFRSFFKDVAKCDAAKLVLVKE